ncbi:MAG: tetratricopeptide repeat protein [Aureibaculum sp.]|nr:tetratricopeptide repeat protein [Aureibaculum sp.]
MADNPIKFWRELKRRKVVRFITVYAAAAFVILELVSIIVEPLRLPEWTLPLIIVLLGIGFIISVILSWVYDITPEGIQKTKPSTLISSEAKQSTSRGWKISTYISVLIIIAFAAFYIIGNIKQSSDISKLEKSIAVLPFENWSYEKEFSHLGSAFANEIITDLYHISEFRVIGYTSTLQYKDSQKSIADIGRELGVNYIVEGTLERQGNKVNIHVQVIRAMNETHVWAEEFEGEWEDIFRIQDEIALKVANNLKAILLENEIENIEKIPTENLEAYNYYLLGNEHFWRSFEEQDWSVAINLYQKAIDLDPHFANAYTMLAKSHIFLYWFQYDKSDDRLLKSKDAIDAALRIDASLPDAQLAMGQYYYMGLLSYSESLNHFETALKSMPDNAECLYMMACVYRRMGNWEKAKEYFNESIKNDPRNARIMFNTAQLYWLIREYSKSLEYFNMTIELRPDWSSGYGGKISLLLKRDGTTINARKIMNEAVLFVSPQEMSPVAFKLDLYDEKYEDALDILRKIDQDNFDNQFYYYPKYIYYALTYDLLGETEKAQQYFNLSKSLIEESVLNDPDDPRLYSALGICYAGLNQKQMAIQYGKRGVELLPVNKEAWKGVYRLGELARIYVMVGEYELALEQLDYLLSIPGILSAKLLQLDPIWKPLWDKPGFIQLIKKYSDN